MSKPRKTLYWGVCLEKDDNINVIEKIILKEQPHHTLKEEIHSTLYFGKDRDEDFLNHENKKVKLFITGYGITEDAVALKVDKMEFIKDDKSLDLSVPTFAKLQHITLSLAPKVKAMNSYKSIEENFEDMKFEITGFIKRY